MGSGVSGRLFSFNDQQQSVEIKKLGLVNR